MTMSMQERSALGFSDDEPLQAPVGFEYLGHKGSLQVYYKGSPRRVSHMRVGFVGPKPFVTDGFVRVVSTPAFGVMVNPGGWSSLEPNKAMQGRFVVYASSPKM